jgi:L-lactate dehydrogenase complex protein LldG
MSTESKNNDFLHKVKSFFLGPEMEEENAIIPNENSAEEIPDGKKEDDAEFITKDLNPKFDSTIKPMAVKKVVGYDDSHTQSTAPISTESPSTSTVTPSAQNNVELDVQYAENFTMAGGKFIYAETKAELIEILKQLKQQNKWKNIYYWEDEVKQLLDGQDALKISIGVSLETSQAAVSFCEYLVASDGSIILSSKQASTRGLSVFPDAHIIIADATRLVKNLEEGVIKFNKFHTELPFAIYLSDKVGVDTKSNDTLILNAHGTQNVFLLFVDEPIY